MFIVECFPFKKGLNKESLSYFSSSYLEPGSLIKINIRNKSESALVLESRSAREAKSEIKRENFQMKKVISVKARPFLQKSFLAAIEDTSTYFASTQGSVLSHLIPAFVLENPNILSSFKKIEWKEPNKIQNQVTILQAPTNERFDHYKSLIREEFAKKHSVFICLPQNEDIKEAKLILEKGIESYVASFHKDLNKKEWREEWRKVSLLDHPVLIIATPRMLFIGRDDLGLIILDKENETGWKTISQPFIDLRFFAERLAIQKNIRMILGDSFLRIETLWRYQKKEITEFERINWRLEQKVISQIVDLREINKKEKEFSVISPTVLDLIKETINKKSHLFLFVARKGLSGNTICRDCGESVKCNNCNSPMILYKNKTDGIFKCHQCGETRTAAEYCQNCKSWKLAAFGSGIDKIKEEINKNFPNINLFEIHRDLTTTNIRSKNIINKFLETQGSVLLGTEIAFSYLQKKVTATAIVAFDSLFSIPDFRIKEKIFRIIIETKNLAKEKFVIQTRNPKDPILTLAIKGDLTGLYEKEIADRKILNYPPHGTFIKLTTRGTKWLVQKEEQNLKNIFKEYNPAIFYSIHEKKGEQMAINMVIKLSNEEWSLDTLTPNDPHPLLLLLKSLPPSYEIKIDPDSLL